MTTITIAVVGPSKVGKTQLCTRLTSHRFDNVWKETKQKTLFFRRFQDKSLDGIVCLEDTEPSEVLRTEIFTPKFWFESEDDEYDDDDDGKKKRKKKGIKNIHDTNPIDTNTNRKRDAVFIVFSMDSMASFNEAVELTTQLFVRLGFNLQGWKKAPVAVVLIGNKSDTIGKKREVTTADVQSALKQFTSEVQFDPVTKEPVQHCKFVEVSAKLGTNCDQLIGMTVDMVLTRPSKAAVNTPDSLDGMWGSLLRKYEWARVVNQEMDDVTRVVAKSKRKASKFFRPIFSMKWVPKMPKIPEIPVHEKMKIFPRKMWCCFCLRKPPSPEDEEEAEQEEDLLDEEQHVAAEETEDESDQSE